MEIDMQKKKVSLLAKFAVIFIVFILVTLVMTGIGTYYNQTRIDRETRLTHMQQINTYFDSLITADGYTFLAYQELLLKYRDEVAIPIDFDDYGDAEVDFYNSFYEEYPDGIPGENPSYYDMSKELQLKFVVYQHEYWLLMFEQARPDMDLIYTYYVTPTGEDEYIYWMIDGIREPSETVGEENLYLCAVANDPSDEGHENMWYALNKGEPSDDYDVYDNEYGRTYAYYRPVTIDGKVRGAIGVEVEIDNVNRAIIRSTARQIAIMAAILIVATIALMYWINRRFIKKIENLSGSVTSYARDKDASISKTIENDITGYDELAALSNQTAAMILELDNYMKSIVATTKELNQTKEQAERMGELAIKDSLTGIRNKTAYDDNVKKLEWELEDGESKFGIAIVDLNFLKRINDTYGHENGNKAIIKICRIVCEVFEHSPVFRIGGDEFAIILKNRDYEHIDELVEEFRKTLSDLAADSTLKPWEAVSAAIGYALFEPSMDSSVANVFKRADKAMYENKRAMKATRE